MASALDAAHRRGLVHRDVKPANILIASDEGEEHVYLSDFGLTKHASSRSGLTRTGQFMGTVDYVAPEQIQGQDVDGRADEYSLACVLYECLTANVPYAKDSDVATLFGHIQDPPPRVTDAVPGLPARAGRGHRDGDGEGAGRPVRDVRRDAPGDVAGDRRAIRSSGVALRTVVGRRGTVDRRADAGRQRADVVPAVRGTAERSRRGRRPRASRPRRPRESRHPR